MDVGGALASPCLPRRAVAGCQAAQLIQIDQVTSPMPSQPSKQIETFDNPHPERDYEIRMTCPEFTCLCPKTGQPDFATLKLTYIADRKCVELKSLKMYLWSFRDEGAFHEAVTNRILDDLANATEPRWMKLEADFYVRGGIHTVISAEHRKPDFDGPR